HGLPAWGLVDNAGQLRPVARTFAFLVRLFKDARGGSFTPGDLYDHKAGIFRAVVDKPGARITVLWNQTGADATYRLPAHAASATLYDKFGRRRTITPRGSVYVLSLPGGHDFTNPYDHRLPTVGGDPSIVVETTARQTALRVDQASASRVTTRRRRQTGAVCRCRRGYMCP